MCGRGDDPAAEREVSHHVEVPIHRTEIDRHQNRDAVARPTPGGVPGIDREMKRGHHEIIRGGRRSEPAWIEILSLDRDDDLAKPIARFPPSSLPRNGGRLALRDDWLGELPESLGLGGPEVGPEVSCRQRIDRGDGIRTAVVGSCQRLEKSEAPDSVGDGVVDTEQERVATRAMRDQDAKRGGRFQVDRPAVEFGPSRIHLAVFVIPNTLDEVVGVHLADLPLRRSKELSRRNDPGPGHRVEGDRGPERLPEPVRVEPAGDPILGLDRQGLLGPVGGLQDFLEDRQRRTHDGHSKRPHQREWKQAAGDTD